MSFSDGSRPPPLRNIAGWHADKKRKLNTDNKDNNSANKLNPMGVVVNNPVGNSRKRKQSGTGRKARKVTKMLLRYKMKGKGHCSCSHKGKGRRRGRGYSKTY